MEADVVFQRVIYSCGKRSLLNLEELLVFLYFVAFLYYLRPKFYWSNVRRTLVNLVI